MYMPKFAKYFIFAAHIAIFLDYSYESQQKKLYLFQEFHIILTDDFYNIYRRIIKMHTYNQQLFIYLFYIFVICAFRRLQNCIYPI